MREIKYRVWHLDKEIFIEPYKLSLKPDGELYIWENQYDGKILLQPKAYVIQLSTGLKDRNGVEIYEGDILLNHNWKSHYFELVKYSQFYCCTAYCECDSDIDIKI